MADASVISGTVRGPDSKPVAGARVYFTEGPVSFPEIAAITDEGGAYSLTAPAPGKWAVACATDDFATKTSSVSVSGGKPVRLDFQLKR